MLPTPDAYGSPTLGLANPRILLNSFLSLVVSPLRRHLPLPQLGRAPCAVGGSHSALGSSKVEGV
jgi:hypothetical protein